MYYDYDTHVVDAFRYEVYGRLIPLDQTGAWFLALAILPLIALYFLQRRMSDKHVHWLIVGTATVALLGTYISSCRWLDDLNVNLVHPYNLLHHGLFSVSPSHMVNGTVEIVYYALLTPLARTQGTLMLANYILGFIIALAHLLILAELFRPFSALPRLVALLGFAIIFTLIQNLSSGYGNALVSLVVLWGFYNLTLNRITWVYVCAALLPALRPDAVVYTAALVFADLLMYRKFRPLYWLLTPVGGVLYLVLVKMMYGFWIPTPMLLKQVTLHDMLSVMPQMPAALCNYLFNNPYNPKLLVFALLFFFLKRPSALAISKPTAAIYLIAMFPVLLFFEATGKFGYNPTLSRYYVGWEMALVVVGLAGLATVLEHLQQFWVSLGENDRRQIPWPWVLFLSTSLTLLAFGVRTVSQADDDRTPLGIEFGQWDLKRMHTLIYGAHYVDSILPKDWRIASTEIDTFGFFNGREIEDLWGFSNRRIASSTQIAKNKFFPIKIHPSEFMESNVEVFWVRTVDTAGPLDPVTYIRTEDPKAILQSYVQIPNLDRSLQQAGNPVDALTKYSVVRIFHDKEFVTMLLVRKDLMLTLMDRLAATGHTLRDNGPLDMEALRNFCKDWPG